MSEAPKKRGPKPKPESERKAKNFTFRTIGNLRAQIEAAAAKSKRSMGSEIEYRLQRSFRDDDVRNLLNEALDERNMMVRGASLQSAREIVERTGPYRSRPSCAD